ncbi:hypothetical protein JCM10003_3588 [Bacteroides pyogenes JCM 10003]|nr:hypothetical protein JCM10003_3588 [Bacteroides pyogenes JCM 10003]
MSFERTKYKKQRNLDEKHLVTFDGELIRIKSNKKPVYKFLSVKSLLLSIAEL